MPIKQTDKITVENVTLVRSGASMPACTKQ